MASMAASSAACSVTTMNSGGASSCWASCITAAPLTSGRTRLSKTSATAPSRILRSPSAPLRATSTPYPSPRRKSRSVLVTSRSSLIRRMNSSPLMSSRLSPNAAERAVLQEHDDEPEKLTADEHDETTLAAAGDGGAVLPDGAREREEPEERAGVRAEDAVAEQKPAGEAPEHPGAEPVGDDRDEDRRPGARPAGEPGERDGRDPEDQERTDAHERPARHVPFRYSGRQRSSRVSTCLIPSAITMPITPSATRATIMSAAFSVPSDWMMR